MKGYGWADDSGRNPPQVVRLQDNTSYCVYLAPVIVIIVSNARIFTKLQQEI